MKNFLKWALIIGMINIVLGIVVYLIGGGVDATGHSSTVGQILGWVGPIVGITCLFLGIKQKKDMDPADFTFGRGWVEGFMISLIAAIIMGILIFITEYISASNRTNDDSYIGYGLLDISPTELALIGFLIFVFGGMFLSLIISAIVNAMGGKSKSSGEMVNA